MTPSPLADLPVPRRPGLAYVPEFDAFRAAAILSVLCVHWLPAQGLVNRLQEQVSNGVQLFFVLSGFLITRILLQSRQAMDDGSTTLHWSLRQFYARRALRIFPIYYLALVGGAVLALPGVRKGFWWHATYLSNAYYYRMHGFDRGPALVFWSLSVEEQFYLLWPLAILLLPRRRMIPFVVAVAVLGSIWRGTSMWLDSDPMIGGILTPTCANFLAFGALIAIVDHPTFGSNRDARRTRWMFALAIAALVAADVALFALHGPRHARAMRIVNQTAAAMGYALLFARSARGLPGWIGSALRFPPLTFLGRISYGLYVYHLLVTALLGRFVGHFGYPKLNQLAETFGVRFAATVLVATASWYLFERPLNNLKRLFPYARSARAGATVPPATAIT